MGNVQLSKPIIIEAGMTLLNQFGLGDVTMRRIAKHLNVAPGALYWHFANKQALVAAMADTIIAPVLAAHDSPSTQDDWQEQTAAFARDFRAALLAHRDGAELTSAAFSVPRIRNSVERAAINSLAGNKELAPETAWVAASTLVHFTIGAALNQQTLANVEAAGIAIPGDAAIPRPEIGHDRGFDEGLALIIAGVAARSVH